MLKKNFWITITIIMSSTLTITSVMAQQLLWDNGEWDQNSATASSRNTAVPEVWLVDDAIFDQPVVITEFHWTMVLERGFEPVAVDFILLSESFEPIVELTDLSFSSKFVMQWGDKWDVFDTVLDGLEIQLPPGRYYLGARPVGQGEYFAFVATNYTILGNSESYLRSDYLGYPDWTPISWITGSERDIAFTLFGTPTPCLNLTVDNLIAGKNATFTITNGTPGARAVTVYGTKPGQTIIKNTANYCATFGIKNINQSKIIGGTNRIFGAAGKITFNQKVPQQAKNLTVLFQSAEQNTCPDECVSNLVEQIVQ